MVAAAGISLFVLSRVYLEFYQQRERISGERQKTERLISSLVLSWAELERLGSILLDEDLDDGPISIRRILKSLIARDLISSVDFERLERALRIRNAAVHGMAEDVDRFEIMQALDDVAEVKSVISEQIAKKAKPARKSRTTTS